MERLFYGSDVAKTFGHVRIFLKWRGQISKSRGQNLAFGHDILGIAFTVYPPRTVVFNRVKDWRWGRKIFLKELCLNDVRFHFEWFMLHIFTKIFLKLHSNHESPFEHLFWTCSGLDKIMYLVLLALFLWLILNIDFHQKNVYRWGWYN